MPKLVRRGWWNQEVLQWRFVLALFAVRRQCRDDLLAAGGGGLAVRGWCERWGLPPWCGAWGKRYCRERARSPRLELPGPVLGVALPTATEAGFDWLAGEARHEAEARRLGGGVPRREARERCAGTVAALEAAGWQAGRVEAVFWLVRRTVPVALGGEPETLRALADEADVPEAVIAAESRRLARALGVGALGRRPGRRAEPWRRSWRLLLRAYRSR